jgi:hypothetical protein
VDGLGCCGLAFRAYDGEPERRTVFLEAVASGRIPAGTGPTTAPGLLFRGTGSRRSSPPGRTPAPTALRAHGRRHRGRPLEDEASRLAAREVAGAAPFAVTELRHARAGRQAIERSGVRRSYGRD